MASFTYPFFFMKYARPKIYFGMAVSSSALSHETGNNNKKKIASYLLLTPSPFPGSILIHVCVFSRLLRSCHRVNFHSMQNIFYTMTSVWLLSEKQLDGQAYYFNGLAWVSHIYCINKTIYKYHLLIIDFLGIKIDINYYIIISSITTTENTSRPLTKIMYVVSHILSENTL